MNDIAINKTVIKNGIRIITCHRNSDIFSMGVGIEVGSLYENTENSGISHMIEHMIFKGTTKRNADKINDDVEGLAGNFDIYTTYNHTAMNIDIMKNKALDCMEIISDMLMNSIFPRKEFNLEKKVIIEELKMEKDDPEEQGYLGFYKESFPKEWHKYHIAGTIKSVRGIKLEMVREFYKNHYTPDNTVICIASSYSHEEILNMVEKYFGTWSGQTTEKIYEARENMLSGRVSRKSKGISQSHIVYGFDINHLDKREEAILAVINKKLGSGGNALLFKELRDKRGYAYSVYSDVDFTPGVKLLHIYAGVSKENLNESIKIIDEIVESMGNGTLKITQGDVELIRNSYLTDTAIALESSSNIVDYIMDGELNYNNPGEYKDFLKDIESIDLEEIIKVMQRVMKNPFIYTLC